MEHTPATWFPRAATVVAEGPVFGGGLFRVVLLVMLVGCVLGGWFLLRGYRQDDREDED
ncbi:hypothetical protein GCM10010145_27350 [Streptomyces ruber]|uniref:Uncharacterized protein n=2 Tax=Streptomyces TaxID=1883 RepID=A0A918EQ89_9ACTN|nr:hypothetical protein [Streptomyces ruber]GGQ55919.1 hypothetical protein GCM10010145_27350 [Streptomyces ruber]